ncbi:MAG: arsenite efflux transporter metallochaperone ArsD [Acidobacteriaceae bacterium]
MANKLEVFDPPMCCSTGICGPNPDPVLPRFASDLHWLESQGVIVERYNLAQEPQAFAASETVKASLVEYGNDCLPLILANGSVVSRGSYPTRKELASFAGIQEETPVLYTAAVAELVAIGASIASNCEPCFKYHFDQARKLGVSFEDMARAVETAKAVRESPARSVLELANRLLERDAPNVLPVMESNCCAPATNVASGSNCCG